MATAANGESAMGVPSLALSQEVRLVIVGCGAVTQKKVLPAIALSTRLRVTAFVDVDEDRARRLASENGVSRIFRSVTEAGACAEVAVIAVPHHLHAPVAIEAMKAGLHAFVEKPLATNMRDAHAMLETAGSLRRKIGVGLVRRQYSSYKYVKGLLDAGWLGAIKSFDFREGAIYNWPVATQSTFDRNTAGGVLFDTGAHTLDMLLAWLGDFRAVRYLEDSRGGVEANCQLDLTLCSGVTGTIELSRTRRLRNTCIIRGERGEIEIGVGPRGPVTLRVGGLEITADPRFIGREDPAPLDFSRIQIEQFADAVRAGKSCELFAENTLPSIRLFDACKASPEVIDLPWEKFRAASAFPKLAGRKVLVIGGTGFIGSRLVQALADHTDAQVRVLFRDASKLSTVSRFAVERVHGDVTDAKSLAAALAGCDVVFNLSLGRGSRETAQLVNVDAVKTLVQGAAQAGVRRVVHLSTMSVYGVPLDGDLREDCADHASRDYVYGFTKWQGEQVGLATARKLDVEFIVLQPTVVYGPGAPSWTVNPLRMLDSGQVVLVNGGNGTCNAVYVDDVVLAMLRAADSRAGVGERFLVSGPSPVTWQAFYSAYETMLGRQSTVSLRLEELDRLRRDEAKRSTNFAQVASIVKDPEVYGRLARLPIVEKIKSVLPRSAVVIIKQIVRGEQRATQPIARVAAPPATPIHIWAPLDAELMSRKARVSIEKADRMLGYQPVHDFESGMALTRAWASWANLLPLE